jgi:hypothetical protein
MRQVMIASWNKVGGPAPRLQGVSSQVVDGRAMRSAHVHAKSSRARCAQQAGVREGRAGAGQRAPSAGARCQAGVARATARTGLQQRGSEFFFLIFIPSAAAMFAG